MNLGKRVVLALTAFCIMTTLIAVAIPAKAVEPSDEEYTLSFSGVEGYIMVYPGAENQVRSAGLAGWNGGCSCTGRYPLR